MVILSFTFYIYILCCIKYKYVLFGTGGGIYDDDALWLLYLLLFRIKLFLGLEINIFFLKIEAKNKIFGQILGYLQQAA